MLKPAPRLCSDGKWTDHEECGNVVGSIPVE